MSPKQKTKACRKRKSRANKVNLRKKAQKLAKVTELLNKLANESE